MLYLGKIQIPTQPNHGRPSIHETLDTQRDERTRHRILQVVAPLWQTPPIGQVGNEPTRPLRIPVNPDARSDPIRTPVPIHSGRARVSEAAERLTVISGPLGSPPSCGRCVLCS